MNSLNPEVTIFLDSLNHPLRFEIQLLREIILGSSKGLNENIKWNGPNYTFQDADRMTMKIQPPKQIQLIFHRGAKKLEQPKQKLIQTDSKLLVWKESDRAIAGFKNMEDIKAAQEELKEIVIKWIERSSE
ncbi:DUF1801 domain-containing protein [Jiulongibacter sediminis]|jgi:TATA-box binding protein (TBP) (component of TFIID and TFIIIB)|uniref:DUF1801 domain-containing protein n=1 Tax=Jiulongibacter sediminis TaxID=1605367 RepID=UPI0026EE3BBF|nr:DUF1801 domain-containing protein [Jiulongibacter sediminis]